MSGRSASLFRFVTLASLPPTTGFGPGVEVRLRETGELLGFVRRLYDSGSGSNWMAYGPDGSEQGISDLRSTAANFLLSRRD